MPGSYDDLVELSIGGGARPEAPAVDWVPPVDIVETPQAYEIIVDLCGVHKKDLTVRYDRGRLTVWGKRELEEADEVPHYCERRRGRFARAFNFRVPVDEAAIKAQLTNGLLTLTVPKRLPRQIVLE